MTWTYLQRAMKRRETTSKKQIFRLFKIWVKWFSSLTRFPPKIWLQSFKHCFTVVSSIYYYVSSINYNVYFLWAIGLFSVWVLCQQGKGEAIILAPLFHFHPLFKSFGLQCLHLSERFNDERGLSKHIQEPHYIFLLSKPLQE